MHPTDFINDYIQSVRDSQKNDLDLSFVFAYGPYMCMTDGFERECDFYAKNNPILRVMLYTAYLIRKITSGISYKDAKKTIRDFIVSVDNEFPVNNNSQLESYHNALSDFAIRYLNSIRDSQHIHGDLESFMTCAAPIVPYSQTLKKKPIEESCHATCAEEILKYCDHLTEMEIYKILENLLLTNLEAIMMKADIYTKILTEIQNDPKDLTKLDKLTMEFQDMTDKVNVYYYLAIVDFLKIPFENIKKNLNFLKEAGDFSKTKNYATFESMMNDMSKNTNIDIAAESWDDPTMDEKEERAVAALMDNHNTVSEEKEEVAKYDFGYLNDYINAKRFMKFEEFPNRLFVSSIENAHIVNINIMGGNRNYYEMSNNTVACPFLDLRDYEVKVVVLYADTNEIRMYADIKDVY